MDHHYLPQFYQRQWAGEDGLVRRYRRVHGKLVHEKPVSPKATGFESGLYATPPAMDWETHDPDIIEKQVMGPIDNDAAVVLEKLVGGASALNDQERTAWALFLNSLLHRHRDTLYERDAAAPKLAAQVAANLLARCDTPKGRARATKAFGNVQIERMAKSLNRTMMVQAIRDPVAVSAIKRQFWEVVGVNPLLPLLTTDRPLLVNLGKGRTATLMTIPLSPTKLFVAYPPEWRAADGNAIEGVHELLDQLTLGHDLLLVNEQPCRIVFTSRKLDDEFVVGDKVIRLLTAVQQALVRWPM